MPRPFRIYKKRVKRGAYSPVRIIKEDKISDEEIEQSMDEAFNQKPAISIPKGSKLSFLERQRKRYNEYLGKRTA